MQDTLDIRPTGTDTNKVIWLYTGYSILL